MRWGAVLGAAAYLSIGSFVTTQSAEVPKPAIPPVAYSIEVRAPPSLDTFLATPAPVMDYKMIVWSGNPQHISPTYPSIETRIPEIQRDPLLLEIVAQLGNRRIEYLHATRQEAELLNGQRPIREGVGAIVYPYVKIQGKNGERFKRLLREQVSFETYWTLDELEGVLLDLKTNLKRGHAFIGMTREQLRVDALTQTGTRYRDYADFVKDARAHGAYLPDDQFVGFDEMLRGITAVTEDIQGIPLGVGSVEVDNINFRIKRIPERPDVPDVSQLFPATPYGVLRNMMGRNTLGTHLVTRYDDAAGTLMITTLNEVSGPSYITTK